MKSKHKTLLTVDGAINLILGVVLMLSPVGVLNVLGLPETNTDFYPTLLGAVLLGIGVALFIELFGSKKNIKGLALGGAIAINLIGAGALAIWLLAGSLEIPTRGYILLGSVVFIVLAVGIAEIMTRART
jgi:hypothetical protein